MSYKKKSRKTPFYKGPLKVFGLFFKKEHFWALFSKKGKKGKKGKKSVLGPLFPKKPTIANGFVPSGQTYKWII